MGEIQKAWKERLEALAAGSSTARQFLQKEDRDRTVKKKEFLSGNRSSMITSVEEDEIIQRSCEYITALTELLMVTLEFQFNHYLYKGFKAELASFGPKMV